MYQRIAPEVQRMRRLELTINLIARTLGVARQTVRMALRGTQQS
jgi:predicted transcriptional regulator